MIVKAFEYARDAHADHRRESEELYIEHDLAVAHIVCDLGMDIATIAASLLHDILLDHSHANEAFIHKLFGAEIATLVNGLGKLTPYTEKHDQSRDDKTLEAIRRAILTIIDGDTRVILIHLADRLQDLRKASKTTSGETGTNRPRSSRHSCAPGKSLRYMAT